jgi:hypothetical protein
MEGGAFSAKSVEILPRIAGTTAEKRRGREEIAEKSALLSARRGRV